MKRLIYVFIILLMSAIWFSSCRSIRHIPVETKIQLKDSVITRDSVVIKEQTVRKDSVVIKDSTVIVVDESGNVIRTELYRYRDWYKELSRDYSVLQAKYDSLFSEKQKEIQVPYPVERELSWWQSVKVQVGEIAIGVIIGLIIIIVWLIRKNRKKSLLKNNTKIHNKKTLGVSAWESRGIFMQICMFNIYIYVGIWNEL